MNRENLETWPEAGPREKLASPYASLRSIDFIVFVVGVSGAERLAAGPFSLRSAYSRLSRFHFSRSLTFHLEFTVSRDFQKEIVSVNISYRHSIRRENS